MSRHSVRQQLYFASGIIGLTTFVTWKFPESVKSHEQAPTPFFSLCPARPQCSNIFSIKIPYPRLASCTNTCVTAPASFPSCMIGETAHTLHNPRVQKLGSVTLITCSYSCGWHYNPPSVSLSHNPPVPLPHYSDICNPSFILAQALHGLAGRCFLNCWFTVPNMPSLVFCRYPHVGLRAIIDDAGKQAGFPMVPFSPHDFRGI